MSKTPEVGFELVNNLSHFASIVSTLEETHLCKLLLQSCTLSRQHTLQHVKAFLQQDYHCQFLIMGLKLHTVHAYGDQHRTTLFWLLSQAFSIYCSRTVTVRHKTPDNKSSCVREGGNSTM